MTERCDDPHKLFRELCLAHQLDRASRRLLLHLADASQIAAAGAGVPDARGVRAGAAAGGAPRTASTS